MESIYGSVNGFRFHPNGQQLQNNKKMNKEEKRPLLDNESQSDSTEPPHSMDTVLDVKKPISNFTEETEHNPLLNRELEHPTSNFDTMIHLLKGNIGTGILAMPDAFRNAGWVVGIFGTLFMGIICTHCMHMLVGCAHELCKRTKSPSLTFSEVAEKACSTRESCCMKKCGTIFKGIINVFLCMTQAGFCCVYFVFVAANLHDIVKHFFVDIDMHWYLLSLLLPMVLLNWVKNLKYLTPVSLFAGIIMCCGLTITFFYMLQGLPKTCEVKAFATWQQLPLYFGTAIYAFEGIGVILPLENNMKNPQDFGGWTGVLNTAMVIVACLYTAVGFFGYLKYGELATLGSVTLYLPAQDILAQLVRLMMAVAIFLSYGLQFYVPFNIIWPVVKQYLSTEEQRFIGEYVVRTALVFLTFCLAIAVPNLGNIISLVGAFSSSGLALIFPPLIELFTFWPNMGRYHWMFFKNIFIMMFGIVGFIFGTYVSILSILFPTS